MKLPIPPPPTDPNWKPYEDPDVWKRFMGMQSPPEAEGKYLHWDQLIHFQPPEGFSQKEWWDWIKYERHRTYQSVALTDKKANRIIKGEDFNRFELLY